MKKLASAKVIVPLELLALVMFPSLAFAQQPNQGGTIRYQQKIPNEDAASRQRQWLAGLQARDAIHGKERLARRAYLLLMRYHRAANAQTAPGDSSQHRSEDDVQFELRNMQSGPIEDILDEAITDLITVPTRDSLLVWPEYYRINDDPKHVVYRVRWNEEGRSAEADQKTPAEDVKLETTVREFLAGDPDFSNVETYTSYEVTLRLAGRVRNYRAMAFHFMGTPAADGTTMRFIDWIAGSGVLSKTLRESLPPVRAPWSTYVRSATYRAVVRAIKRAQEHNQPLIPSGGPLDYLPGDDVIPDSSDDKAVGAAAAVCQSFDFIVTFDRNDLYPSGTGGTPTTATVIVQTIPPQSNVSVALELGEFPFGGGHYQHTGTRPLGVLSATQGVTGADGAFRSTYTTSIFGGPVAIGANVPAVGVSRAEIMRIAVPNLAQFTEEPTAPFYTLTGSLNWHPVNHYGTLTARAGLLGIAVDYWQQFSASGNGSPGSNILQYNDMSLISGGKFDIDRNRTIPPNWTNAGHAEHRVGINCDVSKSNVPTSNVAGLQAIFRAEGSPIFFEHADHWHLRFQ